MSLNLLSRKKVLNVVGIMNGTSLDGIDFVFCKIEKKSNKFDIKYIDQSHTAFTSDMKELLLRATKHELKVAELANLHHELGRLYAKSLKSIVKRKKWKLDLIGLHGQTVFHGAPQATLQIGESSYLSAELGVPVVADFRSADLAWGGQAAPIASMFHKHAFQAKFPNQSIALHNLGGISNLTLISSKGDVEKAFDTGPANILMDLFISKVSKGEISYDQDGKLASKGIPHQKVVEDILKEEKYFSLKPPKSCGREEFGQEILNKIEAKLGPSLPEDKLATLTELTARSIAQAYQDYCSKMPAAIILCGGGAKNSYLKSRIQFHLPDSKVYTTEDFDWPVSAIEGAAFALLAAFKVWDVPSNLPKTTGAKRAISLGKVTEAF